MIKSKVSIAVSAALFAGTFGVAQAAPLTAGSTLHLVVGDSNGIAPCSVGSCFSMEVSPAFFIWANVPPGNDDGFVVGKNQLSGGQETGPSGGNLTPGDISGAWSFFGARGTFFGDNGLNSFSDASNDGTTALSDYNVAWNGAVIPMGGGSVDDYSITLDGAGGGSWSLDYTTVVPEGQFIGVPFRMVARGAVTEEIIIIDPPEAPVVNNVNAGSVLAGDTLAWTPDFTDANAADTHTCAVTVNALNGNATADVNCGDGTYTSGAGYEGADSFTYEVTDNTGLSGSGVVSVMVTVPPPEPDPCEITYPLSEVLTIGGGQSSGVNGSMTTTFVGHITTTSGLTSGGKNSVKICAGTTVDFVTTSTVGTASCIINAAATASTGTLAIGDKLICTNKPDGSDTDRFSIKSGG